MDIHRLLGILNDISEDDRCDQWQQVILEFCISSSGLPLRRLTEADSGLDRLAVVCRRQERVLIRLKSAPFGVFVFLGISGSPFAKIHILRLTCSKLPW